VFLEYLSFLICHYNSTSTHKNLSSKYHYFLVRARDMRELVQWLSGSGSGAEGSGSGAAAAAQGAATAAQCQEGSGSVTAAGCPGVGSSGVVAQQCS
jgi:hypothetical protein